MDIGSTGFIIGAVIAFFLLKALIRIGWHLWEARRAESGDE
ncbi:hypothetical protein [Streptomyces sp. 4F14]